jgi:hypothetical protein
MPIRGVDPTSPAAAYATKPNIVHPGGSVAAEQAELSAAAEYGEQAVAFGSPGAAKGVTDADDRHASAALTTSTRSGATNHDRITAGS